MPYNGSGTFSRIYSWVTDAANSINISSTRTDAEMNGFAAGLTNCITRDGQSPPSADLPMGAKRLTGLGAAVAGSDALNRDTADARYILTSASNVALAGSLSVATTLGVTGTSTLAAVNATGSLTLTANALSLIFTDLSGTHPNLTCQPDNNFVFYGTDAAGAQRAIFSILMRSSTATFGFAVGVTIAGTLAVTGAITCATPTAGDNSTKAATTAFVVTALGSYAPLVSPVLTGTPTAPTAAVGTNTTQLATTAFVQAARPPIGQTITSAATVTPTFNDDFVEITAQAVGLTLANPTGTAANMWGIVTRIKDNGSAQTIAFGTQYRGVGVTLPTTTIPGKTLVLGKIFNSAATKWDVVSVAQE